MERSDTVAAERTRGMGRKEGGKAQGGGVSLKGRRERKAATASQRTELRGGALLLIIYYEREEKGDFLQEVEEREHRSDYNAFKYWRLTQYLG